jgi:hypothetical protein
MSEMSSSSQPTAMGLATRSSQESEGPRRDPSQDERRYRWLRAGVGTALLYSVACGIFAASRGYWPLVSTCLAAVFLTMVCKAFGQVFIEGATAGHRGMTLREFTSSQFFEQVSDTAATYLVFAIMSIVVGIALRHGLK